MEIPSWARGLCSLTGSSASIRRCRLATLKPAAAVSLGILLVVQAIPARAQALPRYIVRISLQVIA